MKTIKIGEEMKHHHLIYKAIEGTDCRKCALRNGENCSDNNKWKFGPCNKDLRKDNKDIIFVITGEY